MWTLLPPFSNILQDKFLTCQYGLATTLSLLNDDICANGNKTNQNEHTLTTGFSVMIIVTHPTYGRKLSTLDST